jgi:hypothetical protein
MWDWTKHVEDDRCETTTNRWLQQLLGSIASRTARKVRVVIEIHIRSRRTGISIQRRARLSRDDARTSSRHNVRTNPADDDDSTDI